MDCNLTTVAAILSATCLTAFIYYLVYRVAMNNPRVVTREVQDTDQS